MVTTKDNKTFTFTLTNEEYQVLIRMLGCALAMSERYHGQDLFRQFQSVSVVLTDVKVATGQPQTLAEVFERWEKEKQ